MLKVKFLDIERLQKILKEWEKEKVTNENKMAYLADRCIKVLKDEIKWIKTHTMHKGKKMEYIPETEFKKKGHDFIYNLKQDGWNKGKPRMVNDVVISIQANHLSKAIQNDIAEIIIDALNSIFCKDNDA